MSSSKKIYLYGDLAAGDYLLHTVYYIHTGKRETLTRENVRGATVHKAGSKIPT
jgi:hypothetical protein